MGGYGAMSHMIKSAKANRQLQKKNRINYQDRLKSLNQKTKLRTTKRFNELFLDESRLEVIENRKRLAIDIEEVHRQDTLKTVFSVVLTVAFLFFWLEKCWY